MCGTSSEYQRIPEKKLSVKEIPNEIKGSIWEPMIQFIIYFIFDYLSFRFTNGQRVSSNSSSVGGSFGQTSVEIINTSASGGVSSGLGYLTSFEESADPIPASNSKISTSAASGNFPFGNRKKLRSRSDFQAAMKLAQTACSDIVEEDSFSSSVASVLQMKKMEDTSNLHSPVESEVCTYTFSR